MVALKDNQNKTKSYFGRVLQGNHPDFSTSKGDLIKELVVRPQFEQGGPCVSPRGNHAWEYLQTGSSEQDKSRHKDNRG